MENTIERQTFFRKEAAAYLGIHINTLDRSNIPRIKLGAKVLYRKQTLDRFLAEGEQPRNKPGPRPKKCKT